MDPTWRDLYRAIGTLVVAGAGLENEVRSALLNMMGGPHWRRTGLVIEGYTAGQTAERCERLARSVLGGSLQADVLAWLKAVAESQRYRNGIVHSHWASKVLLEGDREVGPAAMSRKIGKREGLASVVQTPSATEIRAAADRATAVSLDGTTLIMELQRFALRERETGRDLAPWHREDVPQASN